MKSRINDMILENSSKLIKTALQLIISSTLGWPDFQESISRRYFLPVNSHAYISERTRNSKYLKSMTPLKMNKLKSLKVAKWRKDEWRMMEDEWRMMKDERWMMISSCWGVLQTDRWMDGRTNEQIFVNVESLLRLKIKWSYFFNYFEFLLLSETYWIYIEISLHMCYNTLKKGHFFTHCKGEVGV